MENLKKKTGKFFYYFFAKGKRKKERLIHLLCESPAALSLL